MTLKPKEYPTTRSLEDELSFQILLALSYDQVTCPRKKRILNQAVKDSPLHRFALQGLNIFLKQEGQEKLNEIINTNVLKKDMHHLVFNRVVENRFETLS